MLLLAPLSAEANEFARCTDGLINRGISIDAASTACSRALHPDSLARCVVDVTQIPDIVPDQALVACAGDRRPEQVATCVIDIHNQLEVANSSDVLNNCQRSILPVRYSSCVIGITAAAELTTLESMQECIAAGYRPVDVAPTFIFAQ